MVFVQIHLFCVFPAGNCRSKIFYESGCFLLLGMLFKKAYLEFTAPGARFSKVRFPSGQREQTVNLPA